MVYSIDAVLQPYVTKFLEEAMIRNVNVPAMNLDMRFDNLSFEECGHFVQKKNGQRVVVINPGCWQNVPAQNREALVFHELGHCFLTRAHRDDVLPNGAPASIMNSVGNGAYQPCIYPIDGDTTCNKTARRSYYVDELFNHKTPVPAWGK
ncbi:hypothetical protein [Emticicia sp. 21SJ11W-3]|uniref:hypothetical protein n=1 Tax=Emticicia sp. 21SJ11W-3 TaxID=2916755 RepID=UPI0020A1EFFE|nr:hypothetical protein [Emticicia sp. 21SJ11W-3]UTA66381.1 hypothetical protein MB380_12295 [Emticicia sp. 21SJ11W-3]